MKMEDFRTLVREQKLTGFVNNGENELALMLYYDYKSGRANAFEYFDTLWERSAREAFELRKSAIIPAPDLMPEIVDLENIRAQRIEVLGQMFMDYQDENWQYWWVQHLLIPKEKHDNLEWLFERFVEDGVPERDVFENPAEKFAREFVWGKSGC